MSEKGKWLLGVLTAMIVARLLVSTVIYDCRAMAAVLPVLPVLFNPLSQRPWIVLDEWRMKTFGRKCLLCSGADKLRKIITLFVLVAINALSLTEGPGDPLVRPPLPSRTEQSRTEKRPKYPPLAVLLGHKDAYHSINIYQA